MTTRHIPTYGLCCLPLCSFRDLLGWNPHLLDATSTATFSVRMPSLSTTPSLSSLLYFPSKHFPNLEYSVVYFYCPLPVSSHWTGTYVVLYIDLSPAPRIGAWHTGGALIFAEWVNGQELNVSFFALPPRKLRIKFSVDWYNRYRILWYAFSIFTLVLTSSCFCPHFMPFHDHDPLSNSHNGQ